MSRTIQIVAILGLLSVAAIGCSKFSGNDDAQGTSARCNVAIIDLDMVARQLGYDSQMANAIQQQKSSLVKQLGNIKTSFERDLAKIKDQFGETPTPEQTKQFIHDKRVATVKYVQEEKKANKLLNHYSAQVIQKFRGMVKTTARQVATDKGLAIILTKNDGVVFDYDMAVDITDAVIEKMRAEQPNAVNSPSEAPSNTTPATSSPADPQSDYTTSP